MHVSSVCLVPGKHLGKWSNADLARVFHGGNIARKTQIMKTWPTRLQDADIAFHLQDADIAVSFEGKVVTLVEVVVEKRKQMPQCNSTPPSQERWSSIWT